MSDQFEGGCLCGAVRFVATGQPKGVAWCHCQSCRKHSGTPVSVFVAFDRTAYTVTKGEITKFNSSPGRWRGFCARCGSTLTCEGERSNETHFHVGAFRDAAQLQPTRHIFPEERLPWLHFGRLTPVLPLQPRVAGWTSSRPSAILCGLRRVACGPNGVPDRTAGARALALSLWRCVEPPVSPDWHDRKRSGSTCAGTSADAREAKPPGPGGNADKVYNTDILNGPGKAVQATRLQPA